MAGRSFCTFPGKRSKPGGASDIISSKSSLSVSAAPRPPARYLSSKNRACLAFDPHCHINFSAQKGEPLCQEVLLFILMLEMMPLPPVSSGSAEKPRCHVDMSVLFFLSGKGQPSPHGLRCLNYSLFCLSFVETYQEITASSLCVFGTVNFRNNIMNFNVSFR